MIEDNKELFTIALKELQTNIREEFQKAYKYGYADGYADGRDFMKYYKNKNEYDQGYADGSLSVRAEVNEHEYERGLEEAWNIAKKIVALESDNGISVEKLFDIFGSGSIYKIIMDNSIHVVKAKFESYEKQNNGIKIGDEVDIAGCKAIVVSANEENDFYDVIVRNEDGSMSSACWKKHFCVKTGRHVDISNLFGE